MKPDGKWKCRACCKVWDGNQLLAEPLHHIGIWTCGNVFCGGICDRVEEAPAVEGAEAFATAGAFQKAYHDYHEPSPAQAIKRAMKVLVEGQHPVVVQFPGLGCCLMVQAAAEELRQSGLPVQVFVVPDNQEAK